MKTIANIIHQNSFPLDILDSNGNSTYFENLNIYWEKRKYNFNEKVIYFENSSGLWNIWEYDSNGKRIYFESSSGEVLDDR